MKTSLIIVESPTKVKTIKKFLSSKYKVEATMGHIRDLPKSQLGIDTENNFEPKYITIRGKGQVLEKLKKEAKNSEKIFLATDPDREGEAISWHLSKALNMKSEDVYRVEFNEITKTAVQNAIKNPREINMDLVDAQQARRVLDRLVGYKISPLLWKKIKKGLSAGRVQSVAVKLICDREKEIKSFVPKEYWNLLAKLFQFKSNKLLDAKFYGKNNKKAEINSEAEMQEILQDLEDKEYIVRKVKRGEKKKNAPLPFTTSSLQIDAYKKLGFSTKKTMVIAQQLYEGLSIKGEGDVGLVSYIRTDSIRISEEAKNEAKKLIVNEFGEEYYRRSYVKPKSSNKIQDAHEAIRPTSAVRTPNNIIDSLSKDQFRLYKLIWERFIASQMQPALYDTVNIDISAGEYVFKATGNSLKFHGFLKIYKEGKDEKEDSVVLPDIDEGEILKLKKLIPSQHFTEPPLRYTEATLVKILEEKGIGRPSTYAPTISTILARGYIIKEKKFLVPTELGITVTDLLVEYFKDIINVEFTAGMEKELDDVAEGEKEWIDLIKRFYPPFEAVLKKAEESIGKIKIEDEVSDEICELCGRNMVIKMGRFGKFLACPGFPDCKNTKPILKTIGIKCPICKGDLVVRKTKKRRLFYGCSNYPKCEFVTWDEPTKESCPKCGDILVKKGKGKNLTYKCINEKCDYERKEKN
ncbi:MAG: type I DNA topoisomerase [Firmicutes bacterium]|nr:type I DNA topoisomerase [Bacillota bacterium]